MNGTKQHIPDVTPEPPFAPSFQAPILLRVLLDSILPKKIEESKKTADDGRRPTEAERGWCFELASAVLDLLVEHIRSPHSAELWLELHYGLGTAAARYRALLLTGPTAVAAGAGRDRHESAECIAVRRTADLLSQAVGHMGGILLREEAVGVKQAALLAEVLTDLTAPELFWGEGTSPGCRTAVVELLAVALCALHRHQRFVKAVPRVIRAVMAPPTTDDGAVRKSGLVNDSVDTHPALALARSLLGGVGAERTVNKPPPMRVTRVVALPPLLEACAGPLSDRADVALEVLVRVIHGTSLGLVFAGDRVSVDVGERREGGEDMDEGEDEGMVDSAEDRMGALATVKAGSGIADLPIGVATGAKVRLVFELFVMRWIDHDGTVHPDVTNCLELFCCSMGHAHDGCSYVFVAL